MTKLAIHGGPPVGSAVVPVWPRSTPATEARVREALACGSWSLPTDDAAEPSSAVGRFARRFAEFAGTRYCVPTANGTSALMIAMEAVGVGAGDEVIIPGLTWVANATTVLAVNATPVIVDIDPTTLCISPAAIEAAVTERTRAIAVVHLYGSLADLDAILAIGGRHGIPVIEDCSHAHGASWNGRQVGSWGAVGAFSMQAKKLLTAGEGGAAVCADPGLYDLLYQLHSDGRRPAPDPAADAPPTVLDRTVSGANHRMSGLCAAVLEAQLKDLPEQNLHRGVIAAIVDDILASVPGVTPVRVSSSVTERTYYYYAARIEPQVFGGVTAATVCRALRAETGIPFEPPYPPLYRHPLYRPRGNGRFRSLDLDPEHLATRAGGLPETERAHREVLTFHHPALLGSGESFHMLPAAFEKLRDNIGGLRDEEDRQQ